MVSEIIQGLNEAIFRFQELDAKIFFKTIHESLLLVHPFIPFRYNLNHLFYEDIDIDLAREGNFIW